MITTIRIERSVPCKDCKDRYTACSDHCKKPEFLEWKAEKEKIREARKAYESPVWAKREGYPWQKK